MPGATEESRDIIDLTDEILPSYESVTVDRSPFYATGDAGIYPRPVDDERLHMSKLPTHGNISTLLIRRPWGEPNGPTHILRVENDASTRNSSYEDIGAISDVSADSDAGVGGNRRLHRSGPSTAASCCPPRPALTFSASATSSRSTSSLLTPISYTSTPDNAVSSNCSISTSGDPCIATIVYPKTRLASTVRISLGGPLPFEMKMKKVDFGTRSHEFTSPDGRTYAWRYDMLVGSSMSLYCTSGGLSIKGIKVATMERAVSLIESLVRGDRKLRIDTDWINEEVALVTALVMLKKEKDRKRGINN